jgi:oligopeptide transport system ATP-binding protein
VLSQLTDAPIVKAGPILEITNLDVGYRARGGMPWRGRRYVNAVSEVSLSVNRGSTLGIVGESGCGKSTLARAIVGLLPPFGGSIVFDGDQIGGLSPRRMRPYHRDIQMIFQDPYASLNPRMTVGQLVSEPWRVHSDIVARSDWGSEVGKLLERVGLKAEYATRYPHQFSGGQRQRISIARALAVQPKLIVCDEAVSALDVSIRAQILNLLDDLQQEFGISYLFISHDLGIVRHVAQDVAVMYLGKIVEAGPTDVVFGNPAHPYTKALLSAAPSVSDWKGLQREEIILGGEVPSPLDPPSGCRFRTRCWKATSICAEVVPLLREMAPGQLAACHHPEVDAAGTVTGFVEKSSLSMNSEE